MTNLEVKEKELKRLSDYMRLNFPVIHAIFVDIGDKFVGFSLN